MHASRTNFFNKISGTWVRINQNLSFFFWDNGVKATKYLVINYEKENLIKN